MKSLFCFDLQGEGKGGKEGIRNNIFSVCFKGFTHHQLITIQKVGLIMINVTALFFQRKHTTPDK